VETTLRVLVGFGLTFLLVMLRLEAQRFGAAEYDEAIGGRASSPLRRLAWYVMGVVLVAAILVIHPSPSIDLFMGPGDRGLTILLGMAYALAGTGQALGFAYLYYRRLRLPDAASYPGALINAVATAFVDEAAFRGALLGFLVLVGIDPMISVVIQALVYTLATRTGAPGRDPYTFALALGIGLVGGWVTIQTGGFAASFFGHAVTRFAVFLTTGHAGHLAPRGGEREDIERRRRTPDGWRVVGPAEHARRDR
jgi:membrane protease YdiL (CAAX protease family)